MKNSKPAQPETHVPNYMETTLPLTTDDPAQFLATMTSHFERRWDDETGFEVTDLDGSTRELTGRQAIAHLTALHGSPQSRVRLVREQEKALDEAAFLAAALSDPRHGADSIEVRDSLKGLVEKLGALGMLTPYQKKGGRLRLAL